MTHSSWDALWNSLSAGAQEALLTGDRPHDEETRQEIYDHGFTFERDETPMVLRDHGMDVAAYGREQSYGYLVRLRRRLLDFTEMQLATVEDLHGRSKFPKGQKKRHENIASQMVDECKIQGLRSRDALAAKCPRVAEELKKRGAE